MKRLLSSAFLLCLLASLACSQTFSDYLKTRRKLGITQAVGVEALETMVGDRTVEVSGTIKGVVRVESGSACLLLEKSDGNTMFVRCATTPPDWTQGNEVPVRMLVKASRKSLSDDLRAQLISVAPESTVAAMEAEAMPKKAVVTTRSALHGAIGVHSKGARAANSYSLPADEATPIYASFIHRRNSRLSANEATRIAQGVIGFSLKFGVDARLIMAMVMVESGFNPGATSRTGAMGLGQLMPGTAAGMGVSNAYDSIDNLYGTVKLIHGHLDNYQRQTGEEYKSLVYALAAYNAGAGAVSRHGGVPPYRETQNYVRKVISIYNQLRGS